MLFTDRSDAGRRLADALRDRVPADAIVYAIPRGGVAVAREVAAALGAPLDVVVTRKLGAPGNPELGIGAVAEAGRPVLDRALAERLGVPEEYIDAETHRQIDEVRRRVHAYRPGPAQDPRGRACLVVDDGLATGGTANAALTSLRARGAVYTILAVPVASAPGLAAVRGSADEVVCLAQPADFAAVGQWYERFDQVSDAEVVAALTG